MPMATKNAIIVHFDETLGGGMLPPPVYSAALFLPGLELGQLLSGKRLAVKQTTKKDETKIL